MFDQTLPDIIEVLIVFWIVAEAGLILLLLLIVNTALLIDVILCAYRILIRICFMSFESFDCMWLAHDAKNFALG